jgi:hypothetical protein
MYFCPALVRQGAKPTAAKSNEALFGPAAIAALACARPSAFLACSEVRACHLGWFKLVLPRSQVEREGLRPNN